MLALSVKIGTIDTEAFCGRDFHPLESDSGAVAEVVSLDLQRFKVEPREDVDVVRVRMADGRIVDLVEFEVESITGGHVPDPDTEA